MAPIIATLLLGAPPAAAAGAHAVPKVALIVGPVGSLTPAYRALGDAAARAARAAGAEVVKAYSPNATWPAVRRAISGASIVVYLGHGNGWPSRYRDALFPPTQDGFGLNPIAGVDDRTHQYFGESIIDDVRLAKDAVVLLHHLCYASGNTEPGLVEGSMDQAIQRVDNYAAGFVRAGAAAVVAEGHLGPAYYVRQLLETSRSIEQIWRGSPTAHGNDVATPAARSPGYTARLDPDHAQSGFYRSLVSRGVTGSQLRSGSSGSIAAALRGSGQPAPSQPSLAHAGVRFADPQLDAPAVAATSVRVILPRSGKSRSLPRVIKLGIRWDPLELTPGGVVRAPADPVASSPQTVRTAALQRADPPPVTVDSVPAAPSSATPGPGLVPSDAAAGSPASVAAMRGDPGFPAALQTPPPDVTVDGEPPPVDLIAPERLGSVVDLTAARVRRDRVTASISYPPEPGLYRLVTTLYTASGVAYDAETQALLRPIIVRVRGPIAAAYGVASRLSLPAAATAIIPVRVRNAGTESWEQRIHGGFINRFPPALTATWLSPAGDPVPGPASVLLDPDALGPGGESVVALRVTTPPTPGEYLLVEDVLSPAHGSLAALGNELGIIRVQVRSAQDGMMDAAPSPTPAAPVSVESPPVEP